jgi:arylsulfatase A
LLLKKGKSMMGRLVCVLLLGLLSFTLQGAERPPNFVLIYCDDLGYSDLGCYGSKTNPTPHLDALAKSGMRFTDFHTAAAVCSASRAALLTGCYPQRVGIMGALGPQDKHGIHEQETLLPEIFKAHGYTTAIYGKWHLGHREPFLPTKHGFDDYFGLPYSNDMWPFHPAAKFPPLPLMERETVLQLNPDQTKLTGWYTERSVKFIEQNKDNPFFLYLPHSMPHVPLFVGYEHYGKTGNGIYADVIAEIDSSVGKIVETLEKHKLRDNTVILFSSDNGPWLPYGDHAGSRGHFREGKGTTFEGGMRVPMIASWPKKIPSATECHELCGTIDILPTFVALAGLQYESKFPLDGRSIQPLLLAEPNATSPHEAYWYYWGYGLDCIRSGPWKLHFPHKFPSLTGTPGAFGKPGGITQGSIGKELFNLESDPGESKNVLAEHPEIVSKLEKLAEKAREQLGDSHTNQKGSQRRPAGEYSIDK